MHPGAVHAGHRLGQEARGHAQVVRHLPAEQLVELDLVGGHGRLGEAVVHLELAGRHLGMVLLVGEAHRALRLGRAIDELAQRVGGQGVVVAAGGDELELAGLVVAALGIDPLEEESFDLHRHVRDRLASGCLRLRLRPVAGGAGSTLPQLVGELLQPAAQVGGIRGPVAVQDAGEDEHLAGAEHVGGQPVEGAPVDGQSQIGLVLVREAADRGAVEGEVVLALEEELLVVVEHVQPAFQVGEAHREGLEPLLVGEVLPPPLRGLLRRDARTARLLGGEVALLELVVGDLQEVPQAGNVHASSSRHRYLHRKDFCQAI